MRSTRGRPCRLLLLLCLAAAAVPLEAAHAEAAVTIQGNKAEVRVHVAGPQPAGGAAEPAAESGEAANKDEDKDDKGEADADEDDRPFLQGAHLETSFEADRLLRRARDFLEADPPRYRKAVIVLQHVIEEDANVLATADGRTYHPVREIAERTLVAIGPEGLAAYRTEVDGQVKALLAPAGAQRDAEGLRIVVSRFFLSSRGDEAAFALASLYLDEHAWARARRLLVRLADRYPDSSVPQGKVLLRLALACRRSGDAKGARAAWERLIGLESPAVPPEAMAAVRTEIEAPAAEESEAAGPQTVSAGAAPALPAAHVDGPRGLWVPIWERPIEILPAGVPARYLGVGNRKQKAEVTERLREQLRGRWQQSGWVPAGSVLLDGPDLLVKSHARLLCLDAATGDLRWQTDVPEEPEQQTTGFSVHAQFAGTSEPRTPMDILAFSDEISKAVSVIGDTVYHIEDHPADQWTHRRPRVVIRIVNGKQVRTQGEDPLTGNRLAACDRRTGAVRWRLGRTKDKADPFFGLRFLAPPVACGERILVPVESDGELALAALDPADGTLRWRTFLCSLSAGRRRLWDKVGLLTDGGDVYVASGEGVVFSLDGVDGTIHWAARYDRTFDEGTPSRTTLHSATGWRVSRLFLHGRRLLLLPVDAAAALTFDTRTGGLLARHPTPGLSRCLGADGDRLWAAGPDRVRCLDLATGEPVWDTPLGDNARGYGCGFVGHDAVYVPADETLLRLDRATGRRLAGLGVMTPDDVPIGNVATDGRRLFVLGPGRVYALAAASARLAQLDQALETAGPALASAEDALTRAERELAAARRAADRFDEALTEAVRRVEALRKKAAALQPQRVEAEADLTELQEKQAALQDRTAEAPEDAETLAAARRQAVEQVAAALRRRHELAEEQTEVTARLSDAQAGRQQLEEKRADASARAADLEKRRDASRDTAAETRRRYLTACLARARIEQARGGYDRAASTYRTAMKAAAPSPLREPIRRGLFEVYLAQADESRGEAARAALAQARRVADGPAETLRVRQAVAETFEREGDPERALAAYLDIADHEADALVTVEDGPASWQVSPAGAVAEGVRSLLSAHGEALAPAVRRHAAAALKAAREANDLARLRTLLRTFGGTEEATRAGLDAAALADTDGQTETAELILHEMLRSPHEETRAAALARLAHMHQAAGWTVQARGEWRRLADAFPQTPTVFDGETTPGETLGRRHLEDLGPADPAPSRTLPPPPWHSLWKVEGRHVNLLLPPAGELRHFGHPGASQFLLEHALIWRLSPSRGLVCRRLRDGKAVFDCDLADRSVSFGGSKPREGHVVIARNSREVAAIGLVSGKVLWSRKEGMSTNRASAHMIRNLMQRAMFRGLWGTGRAATGTYVFCPTDRSVRALDLATGRLLWQRTFRRRRFSGIQEASGLVCLVMDGGKALMLCDALTGADRGTVALDVGQPHAWSLLMLGDGFIAQPRDPKTGAFRLAFRDLAGGGERWALAPSPQPKMVFPLDPETVCLVERGKSVEIRDLATGGLRGRCEADVPILPHLADVCLGPTGRQIYLVSRQGMQSSLAIVDLEAGEARTYDFGENQAGRPLPAELYAAAGDYLPFVERVEGTRRYRVRFLRRSDGQPAEGIALPSADGDGTFENLSTLVCRDGVLLVVTNRSVEAFGSLPPGEQLALE